MIGWCCLSLKSNTHCSPVLIVSLFYYYHKNHNMCYLSIIDTERLCFRNVDGPRRCNFVFQLPACTTLCKLTSAVCDHLLSDILLPYNLQHEGLPELEENERSFTTAVLQTPTAIYTVALIRSVFPHSSGISSPCTGQIMWVFLLGYLVISTCYYNKVDHLKSVITMFHSKSRAD